MMMRATTTATMSCAQAIAMLCVGHVPRCAKLCCPSLPLWVASPAFVSWAKECVLAPVRAATFELPISAPQPPQPGSPTERVVWLKVYLHVSVSATLGVVTHSLAIVPENTGCWPLNQNRVLVASDVGLDPSAWNFSIQDASTSGSVSASDCVRAEMVPWWRRNLQCEVVCNGKWIVGVTNDRISILKIKNNLQGDTLNLAGADEVVVPFDDSTPDSLRTVTRVQFSAQCDDVLIVISSWPDSTFLLFIDLETSFNTERIAYASKVISGTGWENHVVGVTWLPNGSLCTLRWNSRDECHSLFDETQTPHKRLGGFPLHCRVGVLHKNHLFACNDIVSEVTNFRVYHTGDISMSSLCVGCTWELPDCQSGLVLSTSQSLSGANSTATDLQFSLHDAVTAFLFGVWTVKRH